MPFDLSKLRQGSIAWANLKDPHGNLKLRPCVVLTETSEIILDGPFVVVAITTTYPAPPPFEFVELPWSPMGHPATGLRKRSAAACHWLVSTKSSEIVEIRGCIPTNLMLKIVERVKKIHSDNSAT